MKTGLELITQERKRQIEHLGYDVKNDAYYANNELANAAICYAYAPELRDNVTEDGLSIEEVLWPWSLEYWKPTPEDRIRELTKAGALIAAQIDRIIYESEK